MNNEIKTKSTQKLTDVVTQMRDDQYEFFLNSTNEPTIMVPDDGFQQDWSADSQRIKDLIQSIYYELTGKVIKSSDRDFLMAQLREECRKGGRRKPRELQELVIEIALKTGFGYTRIIGELRKLGIKKISRQTVRNILKEEGIKPGPDRTSDSWSDFLKRHGETLWGCDFFSVKSVTTKGIRDLYVMVFLCLQTREAIVTESTEHPNSTWVCEQTQKFIEQSRGRDAKPTMIIHDRDGKYTKEFTKTLQQSGIQTNPLPKASPNLNGRCERFIETIKLECLAKFIIFGKQHLDHLVSGFTSYYNTCRSHTARDHLPPIRELPDEVVVLSRDEIQVVSHVGGLVKSFEQKAA